MLAAAVIDGFRDVVLWPPETMTFFRVSAKQFVRKTVIMNVEFDSVSTSSRNFSISFLRARNL